MSLSQNKPYKSQKQKNVKFEHKYVSFHLRQTIKSSQILQFQLFILIFLFCQLLQFHQDSIDYLWNKEVIPPQDIFKMKSQARTQIKKSQPKVIGSTHLNNPKNPLSKPNLKMKKCPSPPKTKRHLEKLEQKKREENELKEKDQKQKKQREEKKAKVLQEKKALIEKFIPIIRSQYDIEDFETKILSGGLESDSILLKTKAKEYVFKIQNMTKHKLTLKHYEVQDRILQYLEKHAKKGDPKTEDVLNYPKLVRNLDGEGTFSVKFGTNEYSGRMITFLEGDVMGYDSYQKFGEERMRVAGILHRDLRGFEDHFHQPHKDSLKKNFQCEERLACLKKVIRIRNVSCLEQNPNSKRIRLDEPEVKVFEQFQKEKIYYKQFIEGYYSRFLKNLADYRQCLCHQDLHGLNLIMDDAREKVTGVIDFGWTMKYSYFFSEFNMIFMIQLNSMPDGITGEQFLSTFCRYVQEFYQTYPLQNLEIEGIYYTMGLHLLRYPDIGRYSKESKMTKFGRMALQYLKTDPEQLMERMLTACLPKEK